ncbi:amine sulfotransferase-like [Latimeria chalumnae]|uniref:amine sulfotransferase-like n=1 Tax=Latimeria chalumnae TaxID=7897 RepID=UPI0003C1AD81|nr:PREDICTED: amine sulfotransferase-like isoform X1 [Latimeria chalumnae]|eukprot:XP_006012753.1 PREDICTED: amine sulfotransferase-like isoform X1 [Latimeria chalumnae]
MVEVVAEVGSLFEHKGCVFIASVYKADYLEQLQDFKLRESDVFVVTYPKSGTIWMQQILSLIYSDCSLDETDNKPTIDRVPWIEVPQTGLTFNEQSSPRLYVSHLPYNLIPKDLKNKIGKVIYVTRNPKDVAVSYYHFHNYANILKTPKDFTEFLQTFLDGQVNFGNWFDHIKGWHSHKDEFNILCLRYEDLLKDLKSSIQKICDFLERQLDEEKLEEIAERCTFNKMKDNRMANYTTIPESILDHKKGAYLRKGVAGDWKNYFTVAQSEMFDKIIQEQLKDIPLTFT